MSRSLGGDEIKKLVATSGHQAAAIDARKKWPGAETRTLAQAVKERRPTVVINDRRFNIRYSTHFDKTVFVWPHNGTRPCGYFSVDKLEAILGGDDE